MQVKSKLIILAPRNCTYHGPIDSGIVGNVGGVGKSSRGGVFVEDDGGEVGAGGVEGAGAFCERNDVRE